MNEDFSSEELPGTLVLMTAAGELDIPMSGTAGTGGLLTVSPLTVSAGNVKVGGQKVVTFMVRNTGASPLTITRSQAPAGGASFMAQTTLATGMVIAAERR